MAQALLINDNVRALIQALIEKAAANPTSFEDGQRLAERRANGETTLEENNAFTIIVPVAHLVTYTHEHQREDCVCRHISISLADKPGFMPHPQAVKVLLKEFGFVNELRGLPVWITDDRIIEFVEPLDGDLDRLRMPA